MTYKKLRQVTLGLSTALIAGLFTTPLHAKGADDRGIFLAAPGRTTARVPAGYVIHADSNGTPIPTFGVNGYLNVNILSAPLLTTFVFEPLLQNDGKFLVSGSNCIIPPIRNCTHFISRYTDEGVLDTTFGDATTPGHVEYNAVQGLPADSIVAQGDDHFLVNKTLGPSALNPQIIVGGLVRYDKDGHQDMSFAGTGIYAPDFFAGVKLVQDNGASMVLWNNFTAPAPAYSLVRLTKEGAVDSDFNGGAPLALPAALGAFVGIDEVNGKGKYLVAGLTATDLVTLRLKKDGSVDNSYGTDGMVTHPLGAQFSSTSKLNVLKNDRVLISGRSADGKIVLVKLKNNGDLATNFGTGGVTTFGFLPGTENDSLRAVDVDHDGKITVRAWVGGVPGATTQLDGAARLLKDGTLDTSFGTGGTVIYPLPPSR